MRSVGQVILENVSYDQVQDVGKEKPYNIMANGGRNNSQRQVSSNDAHHKSHKNLRMLPLGNGRSITSTTHGGYTGGGMIPKPTINGLSKTQYMGRPQNGDSKGMSMRTKEPSMVENLGIWVFAVPAVVAGLCFARSLFGEFVHDDVWAILNNPDSRGETNLSTIFKNDFWGKAMDDNTSHKSYRPLCVLSFRVNVYWSGLEPFYFHAVNVALHCMVSALLGYICSTAVFEDRKQAVASSLLFAVHPVHTEAVAGIVGRADVMSCALFLLAFLCYIRASSAQQSRNMWDVAAPFLKRALLISFHVIVVLGFRVYIMGGSMPLFSEQDNPASFSPHLLSRFLTFSYLLAFNACLLLGPLTLCYDWQVGSIPLVHSILDIRNMSTFLLSAVLLSLVLRCLTGSKRTGHREVTVGLLFLIFPFIPASNLFFRVGFVVAERVLYMPSMGFCILCVHGLKRLSARAGPGGSSATTFGFLLLLVLFSCKSVSQSECWRSRESLFRSGVQTLPHNAKVHYNYANFLKDQNRKEEAIKHYKTVLRLYPQHPSALNNLGTLTTNVTAAEEYYRNALEISPHHSRALFNLGNLLRTQGRNEEAEVILKESLLHGPYFADAYSSLGSLLADQKRYEEAEEVYLAGIKNCPESSDLQNNYGVFLVDVGAPQKAVSHYLLALQLRPNHHVAMLNLGRLYRSLNQNSEAEMWYKKALQLSRDIDVISPLGALYYNTGQYDEALRLYKEATALHPHSVQLRLSLAQVQAVMGLTDEAEGLARHIADEVPDCTECFRLLSAIYSKQEEHSKALDMIDIALQMKSQDSKIISELYFTKGNQLRELNRLDEAFQSYSRVTDLSPKQAQAWMNMGGIKHIQGDYNAARTYYKKAATLDPDSKLLRENLAKLQRLESKLQETKGKDGGEEEEKIQ
ncbi:protein O-mannosyl-transferase TMTC1 isoform X2 [Ranitomeya variabilis]|uniref:protein O-mannosyl-transferase TMTC1 isoform X2 n=1 Tax=Ranitomeya variabilis TaxID=490064 RepID=UPI0040575467